MKILPCPFCGSKNAGLYIHRTRFNAYVVVKCPICYASCGAVKAPEDLFDDDEWTETSYAQTAIEKWNMRTAKREDPS